MDYIYIYTYIYIVMVQLIEHLPNKYEALSSIHSNNNKNLNKPIN
jgi:hypothetical protein